MSWIVVEKSRDQENTFKKLESDNLIIKNSEWLMKYLTVDQLIFPT